MKWVLGYNHPQLELLLKLLSGILKKISKMHQYLFQSNGLIEKAIESDVKD